MRAQTGKDPERNQIWNQNQAKEDNCAKETWKKCCIKVIQTTIRQKVSLSSPMCLYTCTLFLPNKHFFWLHWFPSCCRNLFLQSWCAKALSLALVSGGLVARFQCSPCVCWLLSLAGVLKSCLKLLQVEAT